MICLLVATLIASRGSTDVEQLLRMMTREARSETYVEPTLEQYAGARDLARLALRDDLGGASANMRALGFQADHIFLADETFVVLSDGGEARGSGLYAFRVGGTPEQGRRAVVVQAPHGYYDARTGVLARRVFAATAAQAFCRNTAQRYVTPNADVAHARLSYFQAVTEAACAEWSDAVVLQLHGFARAKHEEFPDAVEVVVSDGSDSSRKPDLVLRVADGLTEIFGVGSVALYPRDTHSLGGTTNVQGRHVLRHTDDTFVHLELSREARDLLVEDDDVFASFCEAVESLTRR